jgi:hypothetical protein
VDANDGGGNLSQMAAVANDDGNNAKRIHAGIPLTVKMLM